MTHFIRRITVFSLIALASGVSSAPLATAQCTHSCAAPYQSEDWDDGGWDDVTCNDCESCDQSGDCGRGPVGFTLSDQNGCGTGSHANCRTGCGTGCQQPCGGCKPVCCTPICCDSSCCGGGYGCGCGCCLRFGDFPRCCCGCGCNGCGANLGCGSGLLSAICGGTSCGGTSCGGTDCGGTGCGTNAYPMGIEGLRVRGGGCGSSSCGHGDYAAGSASKGGSWFSIFGGGSGSRSGCEKHGDGSGCGKHGHGCCRGCCRTPQGNSFYCGMPAPEYPVPYPTPLPTAYTYHTYPPLAPHNSLPHYRGTYSFKHGPGLSRTNVHWRPTTVCNAIDRVHHCLEIAR